MNSTTVSPDTLLAQCQVVYDSLLLSIDFSEPRFRCALACVAFNPIFWNIAARLEYSTHILTKIGGGTKRGCYLLALTIFSLGIGRDYMYEQALRLQQTSPYMQCDALVYLGYAAIGLGQLLVLTSMYQLGITGTYLGDYFGILMDSRVTAFPFNVSNNPMYQGSTLSFLGMALVAGKPAGLVVAAAVHLMYAIALWFEEPFTAKIYARRDQQRGDKKLQ